MNLDPSTIFQAFLENNRNMTFATDLNYCYLAFNEKYKVKMKDIYGIEISQGMDALASILSETEKKKIREMLDKTFAGESSAVREYVHAPGPAHEIYEYFYFPLRTKEKIFGGALVATDVSHEILAALSQEEYTRKLEKMMYKASHKLRQPIAQILGLAQVINFEKNSPEEIMHILKLFKVSASKLDQFTVEITKFVHAFIKNKEQKKSFLEMEKCSETL